MLQKQLFVIVLLLAMSEARAVADGQDSRATDQEHAKSLTITTNYVHQWIPFPSVSEERVDANGKLTVGATEGRISVVYFLSTHCLPCQKIMDRFLKIKQRFEPLYTDFYFVFLNDTIEDAKGFTKEYKLTNAVRAKLSSREFREKFHAQTVPMIYVSDRNKWIATRYPMTYGNNEVISDAALDDLESFLQYVTAY